MFCKLKASLLREYEAMFLINTSSLREEGEQIQKVKNLIEKHHIEILSCTKWDERKLYYEIKGQKRAAYILAYLKSDPPVINKLYRDCQLTDYILRTLISVRDPSVEALGAKVLLDKVEETAPVEASSEEESTKVE